MGGRWSLFPQLPYWFGRPRLFFPSPSCSASDGANAPNFHGQKKRRSHSEQDYALKRQLFLCEQGSEYDVEFEDGAEKS